MARRRRRAAVTSSSPPGEADSDEDQVIEVLDSDGASSSQGDAVINLLDDEASEESGLYSDDSSSGGEEEVIDPFPFHRLPPEIRLRVWQMFCPDLLGEPRVLDFSIQPALLSHYPRGIPKDYPMHTIYDGRCLENQTLELRRVMAVNRESRSFALDVYPHHISLDVIVGGALIWFNPDLDIIMLDNVESVAEGAYGTNLILPPFAEEVINLAIPFNDVSRQGANTAPIETWMDGFSSLKRLFLHAEDGNYLGAELKEKHIQWCASENVSRYTMETFEKEPGYGEDDCIIVAWPDLLRHASFAKAHVPKWGEKIPSNTKDYLEGNGIEAWPMVLFNNVVGLERIEKLLEAPDLPLGLATNGGGESSDESSEDEDFESELDAYESDGIDDSENPRTYSESGEEQLEDGDEGDTGRFSSPEAPPGENRGRKRRVIEDSDDEEEEAADSDDWPRVKRARTTVVLDSDEEDGGRAEASGTNGQSSAHVAISDDSDDEPVTEQKRREKPRHLVSDSEEDDWGDEPRRMTLAERLHVSKNHQHVDLEDESEEEDEEDEEDEESEDNDEGGLIDDMAMESDEGDEDEDEEDDDEDEDE